MRISSSKSCLRNQIIIKSVRVWLVRQGFIPSPGSFCCWLKSAIPTPIRDSEHCTSGIVHRESTKHPPSGMRSAVPLGGLGTGSFELRADGTIHEWTIENQSPGGSAKLNKGALNLAVFGVRVAEPDKNKSDAALLRIHAPHGYPGVESLSYSGSFPVSKLTPGKQKFYLIYINSLEIWLATITRRGIPLIMFYPPVLNVSIGSLQHKGLLWPGMSTFTWFCLM